MNNVHCISSISIMIKHLRKEDLIIIDNVILLNIKGLELAKESLLVYQKNYLWFENQGVLSFEVK